MQEEYIRNSRLRLRWVPTLDAQYTSKVMRMITATDCSYRAQSMTEERLTMAGHGEVAALVEEGRGVLAAARSAGGWAGHPAVTLQCRPMHAFMSLIVQCRLYQHSRTACGRSYTEMADALEKVFRHRPCFVADNTNTPAMWARCRGCRRRCRRARACPWAPPACT